VLIYTFSSAYAWCIGHCEITKLTKVEGEASANNRKAKLIFFYEWELTADWKGKLHFTLTVLAHELLVA